jgi:superfamily II DNA or RNA helicase
MQGPSLMTSPDTIKDKYWTDVVYCNSIRELGSSRSLILDDVKPHSNAMARRLGKKARVYDDQDVEELTGRVGSKKIPAILQKLDIEYPLQGFLDVLLATSMISVGVDIDRLSLMLILGQPKTTSEYIQASGRVGRKYPGLVFTQYSPMKSRDRSHFEQFTGYHQSLYKEVEPTSVTPFAPPVRDKALHAVLITLIRHLLGLHSDVQLRSFNRNSPEVHKLIADLSRRVELVDIREKEGFLAQVDDILDWLAGITNQEGASYGHAGFQHDNKKIAIMCRTDDVYGVGLATPTSMRNTDAECYISVDFSSNE